MSSNNAQPANPESPVDQDSRLVGLIQRHSQELLQLAAVYVDDLELCDEIVQNAFVRLPTEPEPGSDERVMLMRHVLDVAPGASSNFVEPAPMRGVLRGLPRQDAAALVLVEYLDVPADVAGAVLGLSKRKVDRTVKRATKRLGIESVA